jgi:hypothetical protein
MRCHIHLAVILYAMIATPCAAQTMVTSTISMIRTGWNEEAFAIVTSQPIQNPARCQTPDGYLSLKQFPGYDTYYAAALAAFTANAQVVIVVHNTECGGPRPKLIGINLIRGATNNRSEGNDQASAVRQIAGRIDRLEQNLLGLTRMVARDSSGRTLINLVSGIHNKVGAR